MSDPFLANNRDGQSNREIQTGLSVLFVLFVAVIIWGYSKFFQGSSPIPLHIQNAPIARHVGPDYYTEQLLRSQQLASSPQTNASAPATVAEKPLILSPKNERKIMPLRPAQDTVATSDTSVTKLPTFQRSGNSDWGQAPFEKHERTKRIDHLKSQNKFAAMATDISRDLASKGNAAIELANRFEPTKKPIAPDFVSKPSDRFVPELGPVSNQRNIEPDQSDTPSHVTPANAIETSVSHSDLEDSSKSFQPIDKAKNRLAKSTSQSQSNVARQGHATNVANASYEEVVIDSPNPSWDDHSDSSTDIEQEYTTNAGDSFWSIAQTVYNDGRYFRALFEFNRQTVTSFENIPAGSKIRTPTVAVLQTQFSKLCPVDLMRPTNSTPNNVHVTQAGETLFDIARQRTGQASRYLELLEMNRMRLPANTNHLTRLSANIELQLPDQF